jgi:hypothetical protein
LIAEPPKLPQYESEEQRIKSERVCLRAGVDNQSRVQGHQQAGNKPCTASLEKTLGKYLNQDDVTDAY